MGNSNLFHNYVSKLVDILTKYDWNSLSILFDAILKTWKENRHVFVCGNGGSAANALHMANDLIFDSSNCLRSQGLRITALASNPSVLTCLANDLSFRNIFSYQLSILANRNDLLIVFSVSGQSQNIVKALLEANKIGMKTFAIVGASGGKCLKIADVPICLGTEDVQIVEDLQLIIIHMLKQRFFEEVQKKIRTGCP